MKNFKKVNAILLILSLSLSSFSQDLESVMKKIRESENISHRQKIFVHTDKEAYNAGDTIYFKAYVLNNENILDTFSTNLYVDFAYPSGKIKESILVKIDKGIATGYFNIQDTVGKGNYIIRAYTGYMKNYRQSYMFHKSILIISHKYSYYDKTLNNNTKKYIKRAKKYECSLFPENDIIVADKSNKIYFDVRNGMKEKIIANVSLVDDKGININCFVDNAETYFEFVPKADKKYFAVFKIGKKTIKNFIPPAQNNNYIIKMFKQIPAYYEFSVSPQNELTSKQLLFFIGNTQKVYYFGSINIFKEDAKINVPLNKIPYGVNELVLTDVNGKYLNKTVFFNNNKSEEIKHNALIKGDSVILSIENTGKVSSSVSISAVVNENDSLNSYFFRTNIDKYLSNYIKSESLNTNIINLETKNDNMYMYINTEGAYFDKSPNIMLSEMKYQNNKGITIAGNLSSQIIGFPSKDRVVSLLVLNEFNDRYFTKTDKNGNFIFTDLFYEDTVNVIIEAFNEKMQNAFGINVKDTLPFNLNVFTLNNLSNKNSSKLKTPKHKPQNHDHSESLHSSADQILYFDKINIAGYSSTLKVIENYVIGISSNYESQLRGRKSVTSSSEPMYLIDNVHTDKYAVDLLSPYDVERVEVIRSIGKSAIYGSSGANGVIAVYTKKGYNIIFGKLELKLTGFQKPLPFIAKYNTVPENKSTTIYWNPNIVVDKNSSRNIAFKIPSNARNILITVQGITDNGEPVYFSELIER